MGAGNLRLQDWFVPVIYQEEHDPQLITKIPATDVQHLEARKRRLSLGELPEEPPYRFQGRSRELLALERLLHREPWAVVRGTGGQGKTTLVAELARWLTRTARFERAVFVNLEKHRDARADAGLDEELAAVAAAWTEHPEYVAAQATQSNTRRWIDGARRMLVGLLG